MLPDNNNCIYDAGHANEFIKEPFLMIQQSDTFLLSKEGFLHLITSPLQSTESPHTSCQNKQPTQ